MTDIARIMGEDIELTEAWLRQAISSANTVTAVETVRIETLGKKGRLTKILRSLGTLPQAERTALGSAVNSLKRIAIHLIETKFLFLKEQELAARIIDEQVDISLPIRPEQAGCIHPVSQTIDEVIAIFSHMGFTIAEGPDIEDDFHNFTALNIPPEHPARRMHDTFYLPYREDGSRFLLRTHTSPVQIRTLQKESPPIRIVSAGRTYRCDSDVTHTPMFHQIEGLVLDRSTHFGHLKGCVIEFVRAFFGKKKVPVRFRPSFFPFTEPSAEVDIGCSRHGNELRLGSEEGWLEIMGCGLIHPSVLTTCGLNSEQYQGFAFGIGVERIAMLKYGVPDLRALYSSDLYWLRHYGFLPFEVPTMF